MYEKLLGTKHFRVLLYPDEPELAPPGPPESFGIGTMGETAPMEAVGSILAVGLEAKKEILAKGSDSTSGPFLFPVLLFWAVGEGMIVKEGLFKDNVTVTPKDRAAGQDAAFRCGVGETVELACTRAATGETWTIAAGDGTITPKPDVQGAATYVCPDVPAGVTSVEVRLVYGRLARVRFTVVPPNSADLVKLSDIHKWSGTSPALNKPNAGFFGRHILKPADVSFTGILLREGPGTVVADGVFVLQRDDLHPWTADWIPAMGGYTADGTIFGWDEVCTPADSDYSCTAGHEHDQVGTFDWPIEWYYTLPGATQADHGRHFATIHHKAWAFGDGRVCVQKGTPCHWTRRSDPRVYSHPVNPGLNLRGEWDTSV